MYQRLAHVALLVRDYDEAINFFTRKLHFILVEDTLLNDAKRWVLIAPPGSAGCNILLTKAATEEQKCLTGKQAGGRVFLFLYTDSFQRDYQNLIDQGISIVREPVVETYGKVVVFSDLYGNLWDLIEPSGLK